MFFVDLDLVIDIPNPALTGRALTLAQQKGQNLRSVALTNITDINFSEDCLQWQPSIVVRELMLKQAANPSTHCSIHIQLRRIAIYFVTYSMDQGMGLIWSAGAGNALPYSGLLLKWTPLTNKSALETKLWWFQQAELSYTRGTMNTNQEKLNLLLSKHWTIVVVKIKLYTQGSGSAQLAN